MSIFLIYSAGLAGFLFVWSLKGRSSCMVCDEPLSYELDKHRTHCVDCRDPETF